MPSTTPTNALQLDAAVRPFLSEPWCARLLQDENMIVVIPDGVRRKTTGEDELFAQTLNNESAIAGYILLRKGPVSPGEEIRDILSLFALGRGVDGYAGTAHGGIVAAILDEAIGGVIAQNMTRGVWPRTGAVTAYLNVTYVRPVATPTVVLCRARLDRTEGRKLYMSGSLEDGEGKELAKAEALYVWLRDPKM